MTQNDRHAKGCAGWHHAVLLTSVPNAQGKLLPCDLCCTCHDHGLEKSLFSPLCPAMEAHSPNHIPAGHPVATLVHTWTWPDALTLVSLIFLGNTHDLPSLTSPEEAPKIARNQTQTLTQRFHSAYFSCKYCSFITMLDLKLFLKFYVYQWQNFKEKQDSVNTEVSRMVALGRSKRCDEAGNGGSGYAAVLYFVKK